MIASLCPFCLSDDLKADRSLGGKLICLKCGRTLSSSSVITSYRGSNKNFNKTRNYLFVIILIIVIIILIG
tara:strand:- start:321 stop:533 length:213 start_codon:yes stop_codon:yes gene_type:complete